MSLNKDSSFVSVLILVSAGEGLCTITFENKALESTFNHTAIATIRALCDYPSGKKSSIKVTTVLTIALGERFVKALVHVYLPLGDYEPTDNQPTARGYGHVAHNISMTFGLLWLRSNVAFDVVLGFFIEPYVS